MSDYELLCIVLMILNLIITLLRADHKHEKSDRPSAR